MATIERLQTITLEAGADLSTKQFYWVSLAADGQIDPTGSNAQMHGILMNKPSAAGEAAEVAPCAGGGIGKVVAGAAIARGAEVASDASGKADTAASTHWVGGIALDAAGADGDIIRVLLLSPYVKA